MPRVIVCFLGGMLIGFAGSYGLGKLVVLVLFQSEVTSVEKESQIAGEFEDWYARRVERPILGLAAAAALLCGSLSGLAATRPVSRVPARPRRDWPDKYEDAPLKSEEFERVLQACLFARFSERSPEYVQGIIVGRLVESDPDLARRMDRFSPRHMQALWQDLVRSLRPAL
jgi:hypothetical protein